MVMIMRKYDDEIHAVEERLVREREALAYQAQRLAQTARSAAASPKGLLVAAAIGFLIGELSRPRHHHHHSVSGATQAKIGLGSVLGGLALALMRAQYGSPLGFGRAALQYAADRRRAAQAASERAAWEGDAGGTTGDRGSAVASDTIKRSTAGMKDDASLPSVP